MNVTTITVAYCPAQLLARSLTLYESKRMINPRRHIVVQGHYPINKKKNNNDIKIIVEAFDGVELWDPGANLGSAQSQNWVLQRLGLQDGDYFVNLDPDSACLKRGWDLAMTSVLDKDKDCALISCMAPMVERYLEAKGEKLYMVDIDGVPPFGRPRTPTPFNLSMWRYSFVREIGGIPQMGLWWGETEAPFAIACQRSGKYHAYLLDFVENESGKFMQDKEQNEWKDVHMRTAPPNNFLGNFEEYLRWKHPHLLEIDTCKDLENENHP